MRKLRNRNTITLAAVTLLIGTCGFAGYILGYYDGTGEYPAFMMEDAESIPVPEALVENQTIENVIAFIDNDETDADDYVEGNNCVEFTKEVSRNAAWAGLMTEEVAILFDDGTGHSVSLFVTSNEGLVFVEPINDKIIKPIIGRQYLGKRIDGVYIIIDTLVPMYEVFGNDWELMIGR